MAESTKYPNLQGKHLSLKFESSDANAFAIYYLRCKMYKTRALADQCHPNTQGAHISLLLENTADAAFMLEYVSMRMRLVKE